MAINLDADILNADKYPYKPDILMGYQGHKVGVFVLRDHEQLRDAPHTPTGNERFHYRLLMKANPSIKNVATLSIP